MRFACRFFTIVITLSPVVTAHAQSVRTVGVHEEAVTSVIFAPDGKSLVAGSIDAGVKVWNPKTGKLIQTISNPKPEGVLRRLAYAPDGSTIAWADPSDSGTIVIWDVKKSAVTHQFNAYPRDKDGNLHSLSYTPDSKVLISNGLLFAEGKEPIKLWNVITGTQIERHFSGFNRKFGGSLCSSVFHDGSMIATACEHREVMLLDLKTGKKIDSIPHEDAFGAAFSHVGWRLATAGKESIQVWEITTGAKEVTIKVSRSLFWTVHFSPNDKLITAADIDSHDIRIWDASTGEEKLKLKGHTDTVWSVAFSPDGKSLASGSADKTVKLWDISKLK